MIEITEERFARLGAKIVRAKIKDFWKGFGQGFFCGVFGMASLFKSPWYLVPFGVTIAWCVYRTVRWSRESLEELDAALDLKHTAASNGERSE